MIRKVTKICLKATRKQNMLNRSQSWKDCPLNTYCVLRGWNILAARSQVCIGSIITTAILAFVNKTALSFSTF